MSLAGTPDPGTRLSYPAGPAGCSALGPQVPIFPFVPCPASSCLLTHLQEPSIHQTPALQLTPLPPPGVHGASAWLAPQALGSVQGPLTAAVPPDARPLPAPPPAPPPGLPRLRTLRARITHGEPSPHPTRQQPGSQVQTPPLHPVPHCP